MLTIFVLMRHNEHQYEYNENVFFLFFFNAPISGWNMWLKKIFFIDYDQF